MKFVQENLLFCSWFKFEMFKCFFLSFPVNLNIVCFGFNACVTLGILYLCN